MSNKTRPSAASFLSSSAKAHQTQQELAEAQARIAALELDLAAERQQLQAKIGEQRVSQATVPINQILRRPYQSRREKDAQAFNELVLGIQNYGFRGAIWVQRLPNNRLRLIAGETRLDAAVAAGLTEIPADVVDADDITAVKLSRVENARRRSLNALDDTEELLYLLTLALKKNREETKKLLYRYKNSLEGSSAIDPIVGKTIKSIFEEVAPELEVITFVSSRLPLLELPADVLEVYCTGQLAYTKAIELGRVENDSLRRSLLTETIEQGLSLSALKARIRPANPRTAVDKVRRLGEQIEGINPKSIRKLSAAQRSQLKQTIVEIETILQQKLKELDSFGD